MSKKAAGTVHFRSAVSGHYVKASYAKTHPRTTVKETDKPKGK